jgi:hypothetical protein
MRDHANISDPVDLNTPLRLDLAVKIAFPFGGMSVSGLRREAQRGRLLLEKIAGKHFVTLNAIERMRELCRDDQNRQGSGSNPRSLTLTANGSATPHGLSETDRAKSARAAIRKTASERKKRSATISPANTASRESATVTHLKS